MPGITRPKRPRADSQRSRKALLAAARAAFMAGDSNIRMDAIAALAGVGVGTLYRHFADREALIEAVYEDERNQLVEAAEYLASQHEPLEALRSWLRLFVKYAATKHAMGPVLNTLSGGSSAFYARTGTPISEAITRLTASAVQTGDIRDDIDPPDLLRAIYGICAVTGERSQQALQFVDIVLKGARPELPSQEG
ncbi:TetR/AcrR family transcriptional regulator [Asaia prunellae]|uniref:TetR/AcrR family transcriptional regulator n=1 Tax=Asaia prunellae TaxID=610245 RepID=UPI00046E89AC|nr:TetR/AcrR family transcriptional regulator [Asaia prunellae]